MNNESKKLTRKIKINENLPFTDFKYYKIYMLSKIGKVDTGEILNKFRDAIKNSSNKENNDILNKNSEEQIKYSKKEINEMRKKEEIGGFVFMGNLYIKYIQDYENYEIFKKGIQEKNSEEIAYYYSEEDFFYDKKTKLLKFRGNKLLSYPKIISFSRIDNISIEEKNENETRIILKILQKSSESDNYIIKFEYIVILIKNENIKNIFYNLYYLFINDKEKNQSYIINQNIKNESKLEQLKNSITNTSKFNLENEKSPENLKKKEKNIIEDQNNDNLILSFNNENHNKNKIDLSFDKINGNSFINLSKNLEIIEQSLSPIKIENDRNFQKSKQKAEEKEDNLVKIYKTFIENEENIDNNLKENQELSKSIDNCQREKMHTFEKELTIEIPKKNKEEINEFVNSNNRENIKIDAQNFNMSITKEINLLDDKLSAIELKKKTFKTEKDETLKENSLYINNNNKSQSFTNILNKELLEDKNKSNLIQKNIINNSNIKTSFINTQNLSNNKAKNKNDSIFNIDISPIEIINLNKTKEIKEINEEIIHNKTNEQIDINNNSKISQIPKNNQSYYENLKKNIIDENLIEKNEKSNILNINPHTNSPKISKIINNSELKENNSRSFENIKNNVIEEIKITKTEKLNIESKIKPLIQKNNSESKENNSKNNSQQIIDINDKYKKILINGQFFLKYGRNTFFKPSKRKIIFDEILKTFYWLSGKKIKIFKTEEILEIRNGRNTDNFKRFGKKNQIRNELSFSIIMIKRTIDLEAFEKTQKDEFFEALSKILEVKK